MNGNQILESLKTAIRDVSVRPENKADAETLRKAVKERLELLHEAILERMVKNVG